MVKDGVIVESGSYEELISKGTDLTELVAAHHTAMGSTGEGQNGGAAEANGTAKAEANGTAKAE